MQPIRKIQDEMLATASEQEIFDFIASHLLRQGEKAENDNGDCLYRMKNDDGVTIKCAIGACISDKKYKAEIYKLEGENVSAIAHLFGLQDSIDSIRINFLDKMQAIHDEHAPYFWETELSIFAKAHKLSFDFSRLLNAPIGE